MGKSMVTLVKHLYFSITGIPTKEALCHNQASHRVHLVLCEMCVCVCVCVCVCDTEQESLEKDVVHTGTCAHVNMYVLTQLLPYCNTC